MNPGNIAHTGCGRTSLFYVQVLQVRVRAHCAHLSYTLLDHGCSVVEGGVVEASTRISERHQPLLTIRLLTTYNLPV